MGRGGRGRKRPEREPLEREPLGREQLARERLGREQLEIGTTRTGTASDGPTGTSTEPATKLLTIRNNRTKECDVTSLDTFGARSELRVGDNTYEIYKIDKVPGHDRLPYSLKILLENLLRTEDGANITADHIRALGGWDPNAEPSVEIQFTPARVLMQDFTGVP